MPKAVSFAYDIHIPNFLFIADEGRSQDFQVPGQVKLYFGNAPPPKHLSEKLKRYKIPHIQIHTTCVQLTSCFEI